jgi:hypothetical protein
MRTVAKWLRHFLWQAEPLPASESSDGLTVGVSLDGRRRTAVAADFWLEAPSIDDVGRQLAHMVRLGTVDRVVVVGLDDLPLGARREMGRIARRQRVLGTVVELLDD